MASPDGKRLHDGDDTIVAARDLRTAVRMP